VSPSPPFLLYPIHLDLARLLIHLLCSNLQQIEHDTASPKHTAAHSFSSRVSSSTEEETDNADHALKLYLTSRSP
jgi:hypothetical protein